MPAHGERITRGKWAGARWCAVHNAHHGELYVCPHYAPELRQEIRRQGEAFKTKLTDETWITEQLASGIPSEVLTVMQVFAGVR